MCSIEKVGAGSSSRREDILPFEDSLSHRAGWVDPAGAISASAHSRSVTSKASPLQDVTQHFLASTEKGVPHFYPILAHE